MKKSTAVRMIVDWSLMMGACYMVGAIISNTWSNKWNKTINEREEITEMDWTSVLKEDVSTNEA